jgi:uncharacterized lipoprotein YmbA
MKQTLVIVLAAALTGCASHSSLPMTYQGKPRVPINKPTTASVPPTAAQFTEGK